MATMPAMAPDAAPRVVGYRSFLRSKRIQASRPLAAASWVSTKACTATSLAPGAEQREGHRVRGHGLPGPAGAGPEDEDQGQGGEAGVDLDHRAAGEIEDA